ncbi:MAG: hypothetical protein JRH08_01360 [Deltaproteobacteria bacterium]|nr:hypothetical protein [Deltaproteobacteria bacterium]MBW1928420.1 hypothetical protein [Deltaproteobacteria bacterium]MBW2023781.1 hypothetical protein [Deltaproteobacteria bacterium]MBW2124348.1 hypothetical protein [Deltaproteobacteria bacterium]RLB24697.1 MAG: hypothetical protein DRG76_00645 [Deltaproteobacteria bacterium]
MTFSSEKIYLELDGHLFLYEAGHLSELGDPSEIIEESIFVTDFPDSISRIIQVETPPKYADVMARRNLEEAGEFDQPVTVITHWKKKKRKNTTDIFFTAVPIQSYNHYMTHVEETSAPILLFPLYTVLHQTLKKNARKSPIAVIFQHGRSADLIIGTKKKIYFANRSMAFDETPEQIYALWDMVLSDIRSTEAENRIKITKALFISWIDSTPPEWKGDLGFNLDSLAEETLELEGRSYRTSFFKVVRKLDVAASISGPSEKLAYYSRKAILPLNLILLLAVCLVFFGYMYFTRQANALNMSYQNLVSELVSVKQLQPKIGGHVPYEETLAFVKRLERASRVPSYKEFVNDLSDAFGEGMVVELLKVDYGQGGLLAEVHATVKAPFGQAHRGYQRSLWILRKKGYCIEDSSFSTNIQASHFLLKLTKRNP